MEKQAESDLLHKTLNTLFNPFAREEILTPANSTPMSRAVTHAGGLAAGYGGLFFVLRKMINAQQKADRKKDYDKLIAYDKAKFPTVSINPNLRDDKAEKAVDEQGLKGLKGIHGFGEEEPEMNATEVMVPKEAGSRNETLVGDISHPLIPINRELTGNHDPAHFALAAAAAVLGGVGGWQVAEYMSDNERRDALEKRMVKLRNHIDKMTYDEYKRTRGLQPQTPAPTETPEPEQKMAALDPDSVRQGRPDIGRYAGSTESQTGPGIGTTLGNMMNPANTMHGLESLWWVWAAATFALTYKASKVWADKNDPARKRLSQLKQVAEESAKMKDAPILMGKSSLEDLDEQPAAKPKVRKLTSVATRPPPQAPRATLEEPAKNQSRFLTESDLRNAGRSAMTPEIASKARAAGLSVDPKDPYASLLTQ